MTATSGLARLTVCLFAVGSASIATAEERFLASLSGYDEVPAVSTPAVGELRGKISGDEQSIAYELSYGGLQAPVRFAHIHLAQPGVNGGIIVFLCQTAGFPDPTGLAPPCLQEGTVTGTLTAANVIGPAAQGIAAGEFGELLAALRAGATYANVHSNQFPGGEIRGQLRGSRRSGP
ncbi:CHRD domain-containing protein [Nitrospira sp. Kam-Ns4a]